MEIFGVDIFKLDAIWLIALAIVGAFLFLGLIVLCCHYKEYKRSSGDKPITLKFFIAYVTFLCLLPVILSSAGLFWIICQLISLLLIFRHGRKFAGLLEGTDAIHTLDRLDVSKNVGNILFIIKVQPNECKDIQNVLRSAIIKRFKETPVKTPKLWYTCHEFIGYSYYVGDQITPEECVGYLEEYEGKQELTRDDLLDILSKQANTPLPKQHTALWEVKVGTQSVKWKTNETTNVKYYPVVLRIQHCLSDATQLLKGFVRIFGDVKDVKPKKEIQANDVITVKLLTTKAFKITLKPLVYLIHFVSLTVKGVYAFLMIPPILLIQGMQKAADNNIFHGPPLSGEKYLVCGVEDSPFYIQATKKIKNRMYETTFSEILLAAISASFSDYFQKYSKPPPDTVAAMVPVYPGSAKLANFLPHKHNVKKMMCRNKFSLAVFNLPVYVDNACGKCNAIKTRVELVKEQSRTFKRSIDFQVNYMILSLFVGVLPYKIRKFLSNKYHTTFMVSILPAPPAITALGGYPIHDAMFWVPNRGPIGMGYSIFSYDGRFQMGFIVDKALIPNKKDAEDMVDNIYKYLDLLNVETDCSKV